MVERAEQGQAFAEVLDFRPQRIELTVPTFMAATRRAHGREPSAGFREQAVRIGPHENLVGVLSVPDRIDPDRPSAVILNAGVLHRIGPHRLHVLLARRLAAAGLPALRLDLAGIGDSVAVEGARSFRESAVADTRVALDDLAARWGTRRFVVFGLCSGADNALAAAAADDRIAAIVILDPPTYRTPRSRLRKLRRRVEALGPAGTVRWGLEVAERRLRDRWRALRAPAGGPDDAPSEGRETPPLPVYREQLRGLLRRGVKIFSIFSGGLGDRYNHVDQIFEYLPELRGQLERAYFPEANHMFTERDAQAALLDAVTGWIARTFTPTAR